MQTMLSPADPSRLVSWNVNGLRSILKKGFLDFLRKADADVICLQEIKATPEQLSGVEWPAEWHIFWNPARRPGYAGTAVFTRRAPLGAEYGIGAAEHDDEGRVITLEFPGFFLVNVYVPNARRDLARLAYRANAWSPAFLRFLLEKKRVKPVVVCGDMNVAHEEIDLARPKDNVGNAGFTDEERSCFRKLIEAGFVDTFRARCTDGGHYTWWSYQNLARARNIGWRIDYFLVAREMHQAVRDAFIWPHVEGSDHCPVGIDLAP
jgi:exodeoxyribonuclease-3